jgi:integrase
LRKFCRWAVSREIIEHSPCDGVMARSAETPRDRVLDERELRLVWKAADTLGWPFGPIVRLLILTGQRRGEVVGMRWEEIDLAKKLWSLPPARKWPTPHRNAVS